MATRKSLKILGISGSLRKASTNTGLLRSAAASAARLNASSPATPASPAVEYHFDFHIYDGLRDIPLYDGDLEAETKPESVLRLRQAIAEADALLIASPEYNYSYTGVLKNAIDWASRTWDGHMPLGGKPAAIIGAAGVSGSSRSQYHLRQVLQSVNMPVLPKPEVMVNCFAPGTFDSNGELLHEPTKAAIEQQLLALALWADRLRG
jgi:chromate reductase